MNPLVKAAYERVRASVADKPVGPKSFVGNDPADVVAVGALVTDADGVVQALVTGAARAMGGKMDGEKVWQDTDQVRYLLDKVPGTPTTVAVGGD